MTQSELAQGIVSVSYLSKIENELVTPSKQVSTLLCETLGVNLTVLENTPIRKWCEIWFEALFYKKQNDMDTYFVKINNNQQLTSDDELLALIEIHKLRYYIIQNKIKEAEKQYNYLKELSGHFTDKELYYWLKFSGYYFYAHSSFGLALNAFRQAKEYLNHAFYLSFKEKHSLYYMIALSASRSREIYTALTYGEEALEYYQKNYDLKEAAQCHILLGIVFLRIKEHEQSLNHFQQSKKIAIKTDNNSILAISVQNIGNLNSILNKPEIAINYYLKSYQLQVNEKSTKKIVPIASLMKEYYNNKDIQQAKKWLAKGLKEVEQLENSIYNYELKIYEALLTNSDHSLDELVLNKMLPFLEKKGKTSEKPQYLKFLADYYVKQKKYKLAATYYNLALDIKMNRYKGVKEK